jgi:hypothetical protein
MWVLGRFVLIGEKMPRTSEPASGFGSHRSIWLGAPPLKIRIMDFALPGPVRVAQAERARAQNASARGEEIGLERGGVQVRGDGGGILTGVAAANFNPARARV